MDKIIAKRWYFFLVILLTGSSGVWLPIIEVEGYEWKSISLSIISYSIVLFVTSATDWGIRTIARKEVKTLLICMGIPVLCFFGVYLFSKLLGTGCAIISVIISILVMIAALVYWWKVDDIDKYSASSALGGEIK